MQCATPGKTLLFHADRGGVADHWKLEKGLRATLEMLQGSFTSDMKSFESLVKRSALGDMKVMNHIEFFA